MTNPFFQSARRVSRAPLAFSLASLVLGGALLSGCLDEGTEEDDCTPMPLFCDRSRPSTAQLTILTGGGLLQEIRVYSGTSYEDGDLVWSGSSPRTLRLPLGDYSATATYLVGSKTVVAVDGDYLDYSADEYCEGSCYEEVDGTVDLELED